MQQRIFGNKRLSSDSFQGSKGKVLENATGTSRFWPGQKIEKRQDTLKTRTDENRAHLRLELSPEDYVLENKSSAIRSRKSEHKPCYFYSRRVKKESIQRPWLQKKDSREKWTTFIPCIGIAVGLCIAAFLIWDGIRSVSNHEYCLVLDEDFTSGLNRAIWRKEAEVGGFGNGQFEQTTVTDENVFIKDSTLIIRPTLQNETLIYQNNVLNLTDLGVCTSRSRSDCVSVTNITNGTIVNPVKSGRVSTRFGPTIRYGRVEVTASLPAGDWLWPAIWMQPVYQTYGPWPKSGEIDIMESRGNNYTYPQGGNNVISSTLHWGPLPLFDAWWRTNSKRTNIHSTYSQESHIFGLEWSESYLFTYVDSRLLQVLYFDFWGSLWSRGSFPLTDTNGTRLMDPWGHTGRAATPFDQDFYLVINLAVGATNGWFADGANDKPWVDLSPTARKDFWDDRDNWLPTWTDSGCFRISHVKMWQQAGHKGCGEK